MQMLQRFWYRWSDSIIMAVVLLAALAFIIWVSAAQYDQCLEDGYNKTQCRTMIMSNNKSAVVIEGSR